MDNRFSNEKKLNKVPIVILVIIIAILLGILLALAVNSKKTEGNIEIKEKNAVGSEIAYSDIYYFSNGKANSKTELLNFWVSDKKDSKGYNKMAILIAQEANDINYPKTVEINGKKVSEIHEYSTFDLTSGIKIGDSKTAQTISYTGTNSNGEPVVYEVIYLDYTENISDGLKINIKTDNDEFDYNNEKAQVNFILLVEHNLGEYEGESFKTTETIVDWKQSVGYVGTETTVTGVHTKDYTGYNYANKAVDTDSDSKETVYTDSSIDVKIDNASTDNKHVAFYYTFDDETADKSASNDANTNINTTTSESGSQQKTSKTSSSGQTVVGNKTTTTTVTGRQEQVLTYKDALYEKEKYTVKRTDLSYIVRFVDSETGEELAESKEFTNQTYQDEVTEEAKEIPGYNVQEPSSKTISIGPGENEIVFNYEKRSDLSYKVYYLDKDTNEEIAETKEVFDKKYKEEVTEEAIEVEGYNIQDESIQTIEIGLETNEIKFYYTKRNDLTYKVYYIDQDTDEEIAETKEETNKTYKESITEEAKDIPGYVAQDPISQTIEIGLDTNEIKFFYTKRTDLSYKVFYVDQDTNEEIADTKEENNKTFKEEVTEYAIQIDGYVLQDQESQTIEIGANENTITFHYTKRNDLSYTVYYIDYETNEEIETNKYVSNKTYKDEVTEEAIDIDGYVKRDPTSQTIEIGTGTNEITFYYLKRNDLECYIYYLDQDTNEEIATTSLLPYCIFKDEITEVAIDIPGYVAQDPTWDTIVIGTGINEFKFYYAKRNDLNYKVYYKDQDTNETIDEKTVYDQTYKDEITENAKDIPGYVAQSPTTQTIEIGLDNNEITFYYKKRNDLSYTVHYLEDSTSEEVATSKTVYNQTYGDEVTEYAIDIEGYITQDPTQDTITIDVEYNDIYFYYTKRNDFNYIVYYACGYDEIWGGIKEIADPKIVTEQTYLDEITENAIPIDGYVAQEPTEQTITINTGANDIIFWYEKRNDLSYTIYYKDIDTDEPLDEITENNQTYKDEITWEVDDDTISGYYPEDPTSQTIEIGTGTNELTFYFRKRADLYYKVNYLEVVTEEQLADPKYEYDQTFGDEVTEDAIPIPGYTALDPTTQTFTIDENNEITFYYKKRDDLSYTVYYLEEGTDEEVSDPKVVTENVVFNEEVTEEAIPVDGFNPLDPTTQTIVIKLEDNTITFYYERRTDLSYTVYFLEEGTDEELMEPWVIEDQTFEAEVTESAPYIEGYYAQDPTEKTIQIGTGTNEITFYYTKKNDIRYIVYYLEQGTEEEVNSPKDVGERTYHETVTETAIDVDGYLKLEPTSQTMVLEDNGGDGYGDNVFKFYYARMNELTYSVHYIDEDTDEEIWDTLNVGNKTFEEEVTETAIEIPGYVAQSPTSQTIEIGTGANVINFYYNKRTDLSYVINFIEQDTGNILRQQKTVGNQTYLDTVYTNDIVEYDMVEPIENYTYVGCDKEFFDITMDTNEVTLYYLQKVTATIRYKDKNTGEELRAARTFTGTAGSYYNFSGYSTTVYGYTRIESPTNLWGYYGHDNLEFTYYYAKNAWVYVNYYLVNTTTTVATGNTLSGYIGKTYTTSPKTLSNYEYVSNAGQTSGVMADTYTYVNYYYAKKTKVYMNYLDQETGEVIAPQGEENGYVGKPYEVNPISITGYIAVRTEGDSTGEMTETPKEVTFYYAKNTSVAVKYVDKYTNEEISTAETIPGNSGEDYDANPYKKDIDGYQYIEDSGNVTGTYANDPVEVIYYYAKKVKLISKYVDKYSGEEIRESSSRDVIEGEGYSAQEISIDNYTYVEPLNSTSGTVGNEDIVVTFAYKKNLTITVKYIDQYSNEEINLKTVNSYEYEEYRIEIEEIFKKDDVEYAIKEIPSNYFGTTENEDFEVKFYYLKTVCLNVQYVDYASNDLLKEKNENKHPGDVSKTDDYIINIKGYTFIEKPSEEEYVMDNDEKTLTYTYAKNSRIIVKVVDQETNEEVTKQIIEGYEGMEYDIDIPVEGEYVYIAPTKDFTHVKMTGEDTVVVFTLARKSVASYSILPATGDGVIKWLTLFAGSIALIIIIRKTIKGTKKKPYIY